MSPSPPCREQPSRTRSSSPVRRTRSGHQPRRNRFLRSALGRIPILAAARGRLGCRLAALAGDLEADEGRRAARAALVGQPVGEAGKDALDLLEGAQRAAAGGRHLGAGAQVVDELLGRLGGLVVEELPVDHHHRRVVARRVALDVLESDHAVVGRLVVADPEVVLQRAEDLVAAEHGAQRVRAHADGVGAVGPALVHRVERRNRRHLGAAEVEQLGAELDAGGADIALLRLHEVQQREQRRTAARVARDDLLRVHLEAVLELLAVGAHRSTPPITGSMDAIAAMTSAIMLPSDIAGADCRLLNDGSRKCTR